MDYRIGVDLGGTAIKAGVIDGQNRIVCRVSVPTGASRSFETVVAEMAGAARMAAGQAGMDIADFRCVGFGMPGFIDPQRGVHVFAGNLGWKNVPIVAELKKHIPVPVYVGNDANCAVIGETVAGAASRYRNVVMLTLGTGVGGGVIIDRKLFSGGDGMGTELGHVQFVFGGTPCTCGIAGCLEAYASVTALIRQTREMMALHPESMMHEHLKLHGEVNGRTSFDCAQQGDPAALKVVDAYQNYLAAGIGSFINIFRPDIVLIGGGLSNQKDYLMDPLNERVLQYVFAGDVIGAPPIRRAELGNDAGVFGAAYLDQM